MQAWGDTTFFDCCGYDIQKSDDDWLNFFCIAKREKKIRKESVFRVSFLM